MRLRALTAAVAVVFALGGLAACADDKPGPAPTTVTPTRPPTTPAPTHTTRPPTATPTGSSMPPSPDPTDSGDPGDTAGAGG